MSPSQYCANRDAHFNRTVYYFHKTNTVVLEYEGEYYSEIEFEEKFYLPERGIEPENFKKGENPDKSRII